METEFNLSEKIVESGYINEFWVKEFIKRLKKSFIDTGNLGYSKTRILEKINKLAGNKLI